MQKFFINGGKRLYGKIKVDCAKNAILPIMAGAILVNGEVILENVPPYSDVLNMIEILKNLGISVLWQENNLIINARSIINSIVPSLLASTLRSSVFCLGPLLARMKSAKVAYPGGCDIGLRPIDMHISSLRLLGAKIVEKNGYIYANGENMQGSDIILDFPSVGATENIIMAGVLTEGITRIFNPAKEPEIEDLQNFLNSAGAKIEGAGTNMITIEGVKKLCSTKYKTIPDRITAGSYLLAVAMCGGEVEIDNFIAHHNHALLSKLAQSACQLDIEGDKIKVKAKGRLESIGEIETAVYPGFPTDLQPQMMALASISKGYSLFVENLFESRFHHVPELIKMNADIRFKSKVCVVSGREKLYGAEVNAHDLRGGMALVMAGLVAEGYTTISGINFIDRGYYHLEENLAMLGADIKRMEEVD